METHAGNPGAFAQFDLGRVPSPSFVVDAAKIRANCAVLRDIGDRSGAKVLSALKAFSMWSLADTIGQYLDGVCASGLNEALLGREYYDGEVATYSPAYKIEDLPVICAVSDHVIFNSPDQLERLSPIIERMKSGGEDFDLGLRINPQIPLGEVPRYDPSAPGSRLGFPISQLTDEHVEMVRGIHFHNLCEQGFDPLLETWEHVRGELEPYFDHLDWINVGGGHHITRADYDREALVEFLAEMADETGCQIYIEPGEAVALDAGILVGEILDVHDNDGPVAIADISATCHMPDVIEAPYRPAMLGEEDGGVVTRIGGPSCLAGDVIGDYRFGGVPEIGRRFAFLDQAHYSMVKTNTFNGVPLPDIWLWDSESDELTQIRSFGYDDFKSRLS